MVKTFLQKKNGLPQISQVFSLSLWLLYKIILNVYAKEKEMCVSYHLTEERIRKVIYSEHCPLALCPSGLQSNATCFLCI